MTTPSLEGVLRRLDAEADPSRPPIDECLMAIAGVWARRSTCRRGAVGCVLADLRGVVISSGYNGAPPGLPHCHEVGCRVEDGHCVRATHAEVNAIANAARRGASLDGATLVSTVAPCLRCLYLLISAGVRRVVYLHPSGSEDNSAVQLAADQAGVSMERLRLAGWFGAIPNVQAPRGGDDAAEL